LKDVWATTAFLLLYINSASKLRTGVRRLGNGYRLDGDGLIPSSGRDSFSSTMVPLSGYQGLFLLATVVPLKWVPGSLSVGQSGTPQMGTMMPLEWVPGSLSLRQSFTPQWVPVSLSIRQHGAPKMGAKVPFCSRQC
jgi:hypothetical protein